MNESKESGKRITREELFEAIWSTPISKLSSSWNVSSYRIVQACKELNVPKPEPLHWSLVHRGRQFERPSLPPTDVNTPAEAILKASQKQVAVEPTAQASTGDKTERATQIKVPGDLRNAHHLVAHREKQENTQRNGRTSAPIHESLFSDGRLFKTRRTAAARWS
jgi:hypothetical protein